MHNEIVGRSAAVVRLRAAIAKVAAHDATVLVTGETGSGKDLVAQCIVRQSRRAARPFIALNCGALAHGLIASELFGHERGAFTGAVSRKLGAFEAADGGTLFLDEIGELPVALQPHLLRAIEQGEVQPLGATARRRVDVRLIAATNRQLHDEVARGSFREDLFHRLHVLVIDVPPLRDRADDIQDLARYFLRLFAPCEPELALTLAAEARLQAHDWPGNVRELRNVLQRAVLMRAGAWIDAEDITFMPTRSALRLQLTPGQSGLTMAEIERRAIVAELRRCGGCRTSAAAALGLSRSTIHRRIRELGITPEELGLVSP